MDPHPMSDRRPNGRCRAYWMAHDRCPGSKVGYGWAMERFEGFVEEAKKLDLSEGMLPCCNSEPFPPKQVRRRTRGKRQEGTTGAAPTMVEAPEGLEADVLAQEQEGGEDDVQAGGEG